MLKKKTASSADLFRSRLDQIIDLNHDLVKLSKIIRWEEFDDKFGKLYCPGFGRPAYPIRLMAGLSYLRQINEISDQEVVDTWRENPYWQYFCGEEYFQHKLPVDPTLLVKWRHKIGEEGAEFLLKMTIQAGKDTGQITKPTLNKVNIDTTVQEKNITFPTDAKLYHRMRERLVTTARKAGVKLRQTYERLSKKALFRQANLSRNKKYKEAQREIKSLRNWLGRVVRDIQRKSASLPPKLAELLSLAERLLTQEQDSKNKLYSVHAPEVECIAKGKSGKKYEFGCKVSVVTASRDNWVIGIQAWHDNPYDGHTLAEAIDQVQRLTGWTPKSAFCDLGYRGHEYDGETEIIVVDRKHPEPDPYWKHWRRRRSAIEPIIGHLKSDNGLGRNYLKGPEGDRMNALLAGCGFNLRKLLRVLLRLIFGSLFLVRKWFQRAFLSSALRVEMYQYFL